MIVIPNKQCDVRLETVPGDGKKALFPGIEYDLPDDAVRALIASGHLRVMGALAEVRAVSRPRAKKK